MSCGVRCAVCGVRCVLRVLVVLDGVLVLVLLVRVVVGGGSNCISINSVFRCLPASRPCSHQTATRPCSHRSPVRNTADIQSFRPARRCRSQHRRRGRRPGSPRCRPRRRRRTGHGGGRRRPARRRRRRRRGRSVHSSPSPRLIESRSTGHWACILGVIMRPG